MHFILEWYVTDEAYSTIHFTLHSANFCILFLARLLFKTERNFTEASVAHFIRTNPFGYNEFPLIMRGCLCAYEEEKTKINQGSEEKLRQGQMAGCSNFSYHLSAYYTTFNTIKIV